MPRRTKVASRKDTEDTVKRAFDSMPSDQPQMLPSGRANLRSGASALPPEPSIQVQSQDGSFLFNIKPAQNDPTLKTSEKRTYGKIPADFKCEKCGFQGSNYDSIKSHRSRGCGETKRIDCPTCGKNITIGNSYHLKMCKKNK